MSKIKHDLRISLNHDSLSYDLDTIINNKLMNIAECTTEHEAVQYAKQYLKGHEEQGDRIITVYGNIYTWTGKNWRLASPCQP